MPLNNARAAASGAVSTTRMGTSDPVDICKGFALFPALGTARAGVSTSVKPFTVFNTTLTVFPARLNVNLGGDLQFGVCGPAYGTAFDVSGTWSSGPGGTSTALTVANDAWAAGFFVGAALSVSLAFNLQTYRIWSFKYKDAWTQTYSFEIDLIDLLFDLIAAALGEEKGAGLEKARNVFPGLTTTFSMYDSAEESDTAMASGNGTVKLNPTLTIPINIVPFVEELEVIDKALEALWGGFQAGPTLGISIPTSITLSQVGVSGNLAPATYAGGGFSSQSTAQTATLNSVNVVLEHRPGFELNVGVFAEVSVLKFISIGGSASFGLLAALGIKVQGGPFDNSLSATPGQTTLSSLPSDLGPHGDDRLSPIEVVFGPSLGGLA